MSIERQLVFIFIFISVLALTGYNRGNLTVTPLFEGELCFVIYFLESQLSHKLQSIHVAVRTGFSFPVCMSVLTTKS